MGLWMIAGGLLALAAAAFLTAPLVRSEEDLEALRFSSGLGRSEGAAVDAASDADGGDGAEGAADESDLCPHCGYEVERDYVFCGSCVRPLPR